MRLTKERKAYVAVFGLGLLTLAADRLFFAPAGASAAATDAVTETEPPPADPHRAEAAVEAPSGPSFIERLSRQAGWQQGPMPDAFTVPVAWVGQRTAPEGTVPSTSDADFSEGHKLSTVFKSRDNPGGDLAIVDGKPVKAGATLDGYRLVEVVDTKEECAAVFEREGLRVRLVVADRAGLRKTDKAAVRPSQQPHPPDPAQPATGPQNP